MQWIDQNVKTDISKVGYYVKLKLHKLCRKSLNFNFIQIFDALVCSKMSLGISFVFFFWFCFVFFRTYFHVLCKY
uniref:Uncharacterized protein n=1 Tax=Colobus angolensis palliatus TaxID=336983 RepID=A0A2K5HDK8_COLAP